MHRLGIFSKATALKKKKDVIRKPPSPTGPGKNDPTTIGKM